jgi:putative ABC transport system permease protein
MKDALYLASRYLAANRLTSTVLLVSMTLILFLPAGLYVLVRESAESLNRRADATPLIIGAKGSPLELALSTLYFESEPPPELPYLEAEQIAQGGLARPIPMLCGFSAGKFPIVGTTPDYFDYRHLDLAEGRRFALLGECVIGATVARALKLAPGANLISSPKGAFNLAGVYPLKMRVVGVMSKTGTPDDRAIFTDLKTTWIISGRMHGHQDLTTSKAASAVLKRDDKGIVANASVVEYNEVSPDNAASFHLHGSLSDLPLTAIIAIPNDPKASALLRGRYMDNEQRTQIIAPAEVMGELLATILTIRRYAVAAISLACLAAAGSTVLVLILSLRLRKAELATLHKIGAPKSRVFWIHASEIIIILVASLILASLLTATTLQFGDAAVRMLLN